jgi:hypothetical protein
MGGDSFGDASPIFGPMDVLLTNRLCGTSKAVNTREREPRG